MCSLIDIDLFQTIVVYYLTKSKYNLYNKQLTGLCLLLHSYLNKSYLFRQTTFFYTIYSLLFLCFFLLCVCYLQLEYNNDPECLMSSNDLIVTQTVDSIRHVYLGRTPRVIKQCVRCGGSAGTIPVTRTAAIKAWDQRWLRSCQ